MKLYIVLALTFMALGSFAAKAKGRKSFDSGLTQIDIEQLLQNQNGYDSDGEESSYGSTKSALRPDTSNGRLFFQKLFLLGKQTPSAPQSPQIFIITRPAAAKPVTEKPTITQPFTATFDGTATLSTTPVDTRGAEGLDDYFDDEDDVYEDRIKNEKHNTHQKTSYRIVQGKGNNKGVRFLVPSKYVRNFENNHDSLAGTHTSGTAKVKKYLLNNNNGNGNGKRKRLRSTVRPFVSQN